MFCAPASAATAASFSAADAAAIFLPAAAALFVLESAMCLAVLLLLSQLSEGWFGGWGLSDRDIMEVETFGV